MVYILLADGFEEAEALVPADLLRRAGIQTALVGVTGTTVTGSHGIAVAADLPLSRLDLTQARMVMLPGGSAGVDNLGASPAVPALLKEAAERGVWLAAICAAPTLLAREGLLKGRSAVCYPGLEDRMPGVQVPDGARVVADGKIVTGQAAGSAFDFGLKLVEVLEGADQAQEVRHAVHYR